MPRRTVFRSCNSISLALILFTTSTSEVSVTYLRLSELELESGILDSEDDDGRAADARDCGGVPGGVVDSAVKLC